MVKSGAATLWPNHDKRSLGILGSKLCVRLYYSCCIADLGVRVMGVVEPDIKPQQGKCYMLAYNQGYANLSSVHYLAVKNTANKGACCNLCLRDSRCVAWTRVAGKIVTAHKHLLLLLWQVYGLPG